MVKFESKNLGGVEMETLIRSSKVMNHGLIKLLRDKYNQRCFNA